MKFIVFLLGIQQDKQHTSDIRVWRVRTTFVAVEEQNVLHIMSVCLQLLISSIPMRMRHIVFCILRGSAKFFHIIPFGQDFRKKSY